MLCCTNIFASRITAFKYEGQYYNATVTANSGLNLRDAKGTLICAIPCNEEVYVLGIYKNDTTGTVIKSSTKKIQTLLWQI